MSDEIITSETNARMMQIDPCAARETGLGQQKKLTLPEAADYMGIGGTTLRRIVRRGELPCLKLSTKQLFLQRDLEAYMQGHYGRMAQPQAPTNHAHAAPPDYLKDSPHLQPKRREP